METLIDRAHRAYQQDQESARSESERRHERNEHDQRDRFAIALKNVLGLPIDQGLSCMRNVRSWPGVWHEIESQTALESDNPLILRYEIDGLSFAPDSLQPAHHSVCLMRLCLKCGVEQLVRVKDLAGIGEQLAADPDTLACEHCTYLQAAAEMDTPNADMEGSPSMSRMIEMNDVIRRLLDLPGEIAAAEEAILNFDEWRRVAANALTIAGDRLLLDGAIDGKNTETREAQLRQALSAEQGKLNIEEQSLATAKIVLHRPQNEFASYRSTARMLAAFSND